MQILSNSLNCYMCTHTRVHTRNCHLDQDMVYFNTPTSSLIPFPLQYLQLSSPIPHPLEPTISNFIILLGLILSMFEYKWTHPV